MSITKSKNYSPFSSSSEVKFPIELSTNDKKCAMKLEIDRKEYEKVNNFVTGCDTISLAFETVMQETGINRV